ncbi:DUF427 domain-containing protein [Homoserinimonas sp. OAct 916]|uniref:DUF427 domain-containing protein n=1 Tax=Homoserinimonas sp. OAct 916 TaxID=2211450 RepID=UPI000DBEA0C1|nr:DUF427 domain-containing protein [Homoserinimonas sp. OAct 916]
MKAVLNNTVVAEAPEEELVKIEGNWYFPPARVNTALLEDSDTPYRCPWKGDCQYFNVRDGDRLRADLAWSYPNPIPASFDRVGRDYSGYVAFSNEVQISQ